MQDGESASPTSTTHEPRIASSPRKAEPAPLETKLVVAALSGLALALACKSNHETPASAPAAVATASASGAKACCKGLNDCKGKGGCALEGKHSCAGQNDCKGQGGCNMNCPKK